MPEVHSSTSSRRDLRVAVIGGGVNDEHDVSLASAAAVTRAVRALGSHPVPVTIDRDGTWRHTGGDSMTVPDAVELLTSCHVAFAALHGVNGEDGAIAGFLAMIGVPLAGSPVRAGALGMDKWVTKTLAEAVGVRTATSILVRAGEPEHVLPLPLPFVVKPTTGGSSNGVSVVRTAAEYAPALALARSAGDDVLVEAFMAGREVDIAVFRDRDGTLRSGSTLEITVADGTVFDRDQKYDGSARFTVPAPLSPAEHDALESAAHLLYEVLGCAGVARFDFFVTEAGVVLNEVNTSPGFTEQSQVPQMYDAVGLPYADLVHALLDAASAS